jgi:flagellar hook-basal body complex protein FliE
MMDQIAGIGGLGALPNIAAPSTDDAGEGFGEILQGAFQQVNQLSSGANQQVGNLLQGAKTDMSTVMIAVEKADVAFQLAMQVRNKVVNAYQDIEKMQF